MKFLRFIPFVVLTIIALLIYPVIDSSPWVSSADLHGALEFAASLLAITAGIMVLLHFFISGRLFYLIISIGFIIIGSEEFVHAVFSLSRLWNEIPPTFKLAISSTWLAGRFILSSAFILAYIFRKIEIPYAKRKKISIILNLVCFIFAASVTFLIFNLHSLPDFVKLGSTSKKLLELSLAGLFFISFILYSVYYSEGRLKNPLLMSVLACIGVQVIVHIYVFNARTFYDAHWDSAHLLVALSYFFPIFGIWGETMNLIKTSRLQVLELEKANVQRDIAEKEIKKLNQNLEMRVIQRTEQLEYANKEMETFIYSISHDLRAPLRSIMGFSEIISTRYKSTLNEEGLEYFGYILEASQNMANLIEDLLRFSRLAKSPVKKELINLNEILEFVLQSLNKDIQDHNARIILPGNLPEIMGDRSLLSQIFTNLFQNAIMYHRKDVIPEVGLSVREDKENTVILVKDNGLGIPEEHHEKIFNIFQRLHSSEEYPGTGIGLSIVKKAVGVLGGQITLESEVNSGSTFFVSFPKT